MKSAILALVLAILCTACATTGMNSKTGPAMFSSFTEGGFATIGNSTAKRGEACSSNVLGIYSGGDSSIESAKKAGSINRITSVDYAYSNILFIYGKVCTIVRGD